MPIPAGPLLSFAQIPFDPRQTTGLIDYKLEWINTYAPAAGRFPIDLRGLSASPQKDPQATWKYLIRADYSLHGTAAAAAVEAGIGAIVDALTTEYAYTGTYTTFGKTLPGTLGDLVVQSVDGSARYSCFARLDTTEVKLEPGKNVYAYAIPFTWHLLSEWQAVA